MPNRSLTFTLLLFVGLVLAVGVVAGQPGAAAADLPVTGPDAVQETILAIASYNGQPGYPLGPSALVTVSLPLAARGAQGGLNTTLFVQNTAGSTAGITVTFAYSTGAVAHTFTDTLPAHGSAAYAQATMEDLPAGFEGSATVVSDQPILAVVDIEPTDGGLLSYNGVLTGAIDVVLPNIMRENGGYNTTFWVQNLDSGPVDITMDYVPALGYPPASITDTIPVGASHAYRQAEMPELGSPWVGWVRVQSSAPVVTVAKLEHATGLETYAHNGLGMVDADLLVALPRQQRNANWHSGTWNSGFQLLNVGTQVASLDLYCYEQDGTLDTHYTNVLGAGEMLSYYPLSCSEGFDGAQIVQSTEPVLVHGISLQVSGMSGDVRADHPGLHQGAWRREVHLPRVAHDTLEGLSTEFSIQNPISVASSITVTYYDRGGSATTVQYDTIPAHGVCRYHTADVGALGSDWQGTVSIHASQPIAVEAAEFRQKILADRAWLFLVYLNGDNDLADILEPALAELTAASASAPDAQAVVLWDGEGAGDSALYHIADGVQTPLAAPWLGSEANLGDPQTLVDFVQWARTEYASTYTLLSLLDHGGGWSPTIEVEPGQRAPQVLFPSLDHYRFKGGAGMSWDLNTGTGDADYLSTAEMRTAMETISYAGARPLDVLLYDACLMGMLEEVHDFSPYARFFVGSENEAWASNAYGDYLGAAGPGTAPAGLAAAIVAAYEASLLEAGADEHPYTLAALDLSYMDAVSDTFGALSQALLDGVGDAALRQQVYAAYSQTQKFDSDSDLVLEADRESYVDLYDLALHLAAQVSDPDVVSAADGLVAAWDAGLVLAEAHGSGTAWHSGAYWDLEDAHGLSVYLPLGEELTMVITHTGGLTEEVAIRSLYSEEEAPNPAWRAFINAYVAAEWPARGAVYLDGLRPGLLPRKHHVYLPLVVRGSK